MQKAEEMGEPPGEGWFPVSFEQQLLLDNSEEKPPAQYNIVYGYRVRGDFDPDLYTRAVRSVASAHESLRTVFRCDGPRHVQRIVPEPDAAVVERLPASDDAGLEDFFSRAVHERVDLERGPLFSCGLAPVPDGWALYHRWHHAIVDAWSVGLVTQQICASYNALRSGREFRPETGPSVHEVIAADLAAADRDPEAGAYWAQVCEGAELLRLAPRRRGATAGSAGSVVRRVDLGDERMRTLTRKTGSGAAALFLAAAVAAADDARRAGPRLTISILGLRTSAALKRFVGLLMRAIPLRVDLSPELTATELISRAQSAQLGAWAHRREPLGLAMELYPTVVEALGEMPLPLLVQLLDVPDRVFALTGAEAEEVFHGFRLSTRFDVELQIRPRSAGEFEIALVYDEELESRAYFEDRLADLVARADELLDRLDEPTPLLEPRPEGSARWQSTH